MHTVVPTIFVLSKNMKIVKKFQLKIVIFTAVKYRYILLGNVCVMHVLVSHEYGRQHDPTILCKSSIRLTFAPILTVSGKVFTTSV